MANPKSTSKMNQSELNKQREEDKKSIINDSFDASTSHTWSCAKINSEINNRIKNAFKEFVLKNSLVFKDDIKIEDIDFNIFTKANNFEIDLSEYVKTDELKKLLDEKDNKLIFDENMFTVDGNCVKLSTDFIKQIEDQKKLFESTVEQIKAYTENMIKKNKSEIEQYIADIKKQTKTNKENPSIDTSQIDKAMQVYINQMNGVIKGLDIREDNINKVLDSINKINEEFQNEVKMVTFQISSFKASLNSKNESSNKNIDELINKEKSLLENITLEYTRLQESYDKLTNEHAHNLVEIAKSRENEKEAIKKAYDAEITKALAILTELKQTSSDIEKFKKEISDIANKSEQKIEKLKDELLETENSSVDSTLTKLFDEYNNKLDAYKELVETKIHKMLEEISALIEQDKAYQNSLIINDEETFIKYCDKYFENKQPQHFGTNSTVKFPEDFINNQGCGCDVTPSPICGADYTEIQRDFNDSKTADETPGKKYVMVKDWGLTTLSDIKQELIVPKVVEKSEYEEFVTLMKTRLDELNEKTEITGTKVANVKNYQSKFIKKANTKIKDINTHIDTLSKDVTAIKNEEKTLNEKVNTLETFAREQNSVNRILVETLVHENANEVSLADTEKYSKHIKILFKIFPCLRWFITSQIQNSVIDLRSSIIDSYMAVYPDMITGSVDKFISSDTISSEDKPVAISYVSNKDMKQVYLKFNNYSDAVAWFYENKSDIYAMNGYFIDAYEDIQPSMVKYMLTTVNVRE